jgi:hypothetical protein
LVNFKISYNPNLLHDLNTNFKPNLNPRMDGPDRLAAMLGLADRWGKYSADTELIAFLKTVAFIPSWDSSSSSSSSSPSSSSSASRDPHSSFYPSFSSHWGESIVQFRRANELISWQNTTLLKALKGRQQSRYFAPPSLRTPELLLMLTELNMLADLSGDMLVLVAKDIEQGAAAAIAASAVIGTGTSTVTSTPCTTAPSTVASAAASTSTSKAIAMEGIFVPVADNDDTISEARERGRRILTYVKQSEISSEIFTGDVCSRLKGISFVPIKIPLRVEQGGHVVYQPSLGNFEHLLALSGALLGFTVMPLLEEDIAPAQIFFSSLAVTTSPKMEVVLRHLRHLTHCGDSLDRWNPPSPSSTIRATFSANFQYLSDHWKSVVPAVKAAVRASQIVPVGHSLVRPSRLFFRLQGEDLSPFMHEVPRYFGAHEQFLKELGVREEPSAGDYVQFLTDLALECHGVPLNPNELRAVVAIVLAIATKRQEEAEEISSTGHFDTKGYTDINGGYLPLFLPDCDSYLRDSRSCLGNDDEWLSVRAGFGVRAECLYLLHPSIELDTACQLGIPLISSVLIERLGLDMVGRGMTDQVADRLVSGERSEILKENLHIIEHNWVPHLSSEQGLLVGRIGIALRSDEFLEALSALSGSKKTVILAGGAKGGDVDRNKALGLVSQCRELELQFIDSLQVRLVLRDPRREGDEVSISEDTTVGAGVTQSLFYIRFAGDGPSCLPSTTLFINHSLLAAPVTAEVAVSIGLCRLLGMETSLAPSVACLLCAPQGYRAGMLSALRVGCHPSLAREKLRGMPGERVTDTDLQLLELKPFRIFRQGEVVAFESKSLASMPAMVLGDADPFNPFELASINPFELANHNSFDPLVLTGAKKSGTDPFAHLDPQPLLSDNRQTLEKKEEKGEKGEMGGIRYARVVAPGQAGEDGCGMIRVLLRTSSTVLQPLLATEIFSFKVRAEVLLP